VIKLEDNKQKTINDLINKVAKYTKNKKDLVKIKEAYDYAALKHEGQFRKTGEPYIIHPLEVAFILTEITADIPCLMAALLHDTIEDTTATKEEIEKRFGQEVADLVMGITKLGRINFSTDNDYLIEYYKKIIVGMSEDVRVIILKLADRLHNMRTLYILPVDKQREKAKETLEILTPIAHHLGINRLKGELEDLSLRYLKPEVYYDIAEKLNNTKLERDQAVNEMLIEVSKLLKEHNIKHEIKGRSKSIYGIYNKLNTGRKFNDIYDLLALRILVKTEQECYLALGIIHSKYRPIPKRFKDYIAMPKANRYQSLHTTVFGIDGSLFEIQIRTYEMDQIAENGIASHWSYKEKKPVKEAKEAMMSTTEQKLQFFKSIIDLKEDRLSTEEFVSSVKDEILNNNIYVFTPKGDVIELPKGATPVDFAYRVHSKIGETMVGALVNNTIVPLDYELKDDDIVKIITNKNNPGPSKEWINIAKLTHTKNKIRGYFTSSMKQENIDLGKDLLDKELRKRHIEFNDFYRDDNIDKILEKYKLMTLDDIYLNIGNNKLTANGVIDFIFKEEKKNVPKIGGYAIRKQENDIIVEGIDKIKVNLANCCNPIPGDVIIGYITKGAGITVHRINCHNVNNVNDRFVAVKWNDEITEKYLANIIVHATKESNNALFEIMQRIDLNSANIDNVKTLPRIDEMVYEIGLLVKDINHVDKIINDLNRLDYVNNIERIIR
jgi:GTP diphosphokinase / guanosine-3',5'-bis(diphosphate) 3'-diphosphatase